MPRLAVSAGVAVLLLMGVPLHAKAPIVIAYTVTADSTKEELVRYTQLMADKYHVDTQFLIRTIECESGFNTRAYNADDPGGSYGIAQYNADKRGFDPAWAIEDMAHEFSVGNSSRWTCARYNR